MSESEKGALLAIMAHVVWGGTALYFGLIRHILPVEIAVNRGLWSLPVAALIVTVLGQWRDVRRVMASPRYLGLLALSSSTIVFNWAVYVWSIEVGRALESSLGYFINPLMNVVVGFVFLGERFTRPQIAALALALLAVLVQMVAAGVFPWVGLILATTFCLYGFVRKTIPVGPTQGFFVEVAIVALPLFGLEIWLMSKGEAHFGGQTRDTLMLMGSGVLTASALMLFAAALPRLRYSTAGLLQYVSPSLVFLTAVFFLGEHLDLWKLVSFVLIWIALAIYTAASIGEERLRRLAAEPPTSC